MELRQLEYLVAVAEEGSFTRAAGRVHVTQPGVSAQIRRLERELGHDLLDRRGRTVRLTEVGTAVLSHARVMLAAADSLRNSIDDLTGLLRGQVAIGSVASSLSLRIPELIADFSERHPAVEISLSEGSTGQLEEAVRNGTVDMAVLGVSDGSPPGLDIRIIAEERLVGAVRHGHPLARWAAVTVEEAGRHPLMCLPAGSGLRVAVDAAWAAAGSRPRIAYEASDPRALVRLASRGLGMAILPEPFVLANAEHVHPVEILGARLRGRLALAWRSGGPSGPAARALIRHARAALAAEAPPP
ncbi:LysR family transcriptional regulator [Streptomyces thioluteus]